MLLKNRFSLYSATKIIFAKIALRNEAILDASGEFASINTNCRHTFSKDFDPLFVLAWVNSKLFQYTYECFFDALRMAGRFLPFTAPYLTIMCIKEADPKVQRRIAGLASKLMDKLTKGGSTDAIERDIDSEFYSLYALSVAETQQVNDCFEGLDLPLDAHARMKACEACMKDDCAAFGWAYWHVDHQYPGMWICQKHSQQLRESTFKATGVERFQWHLPAEEQFRSGQPKSSAPCRVRKPRSNACRAR
ncbi:hypothetical protein LP414_10400 [Polaromonas sp. P1(28)-13]|nr:hypothetical protein LP414_10400 [Polaromonas sp. P1(28)-13]